jgi:hypothetical protein
MCPLCLASAAMIAGSAISTGGVAALVIKKFCAKITAQPVPVQTKAEENPNGRHYDRS